MNERPQDVGSSRLQPPLHVERLHLPDRLAMLAALRVVLGLPKRLPQFTSDDLLSDAS